MEELNNLINKIIENQKDNTIQKVCFCCGRCDFNKPFNIIETGNIKIVYTNEGECEVIRKENKNPVIYRDKNQEIYRLHGEWKYIKGEMYKLAGMNEEIEK